MLTGAQNKYKSKQYGFQPRTQALLARGTSVRTKSLGTRLYDFLENLTAFYREFITRLINLDNTDIKWGTCDVVFQYGCQDIAC
jgi:hypothetical protein